MGTTKKYYWLKLQSDFFKQPRIKKLRRIAGGDTYTIIYLELQLLSLQNDGVLIFEGIEDNFIEELALTLDEDIENVKVTVMYLINQGLMEEVKEDEYALIETMKNVGSESTSAKRVREHRKKVKALQCNTSVTICNTEIEKEIEKDKEIEKREETKKETFVSVIDSYTTFPSLVSSLKDYVEMRKKMKGFTIRALKLNLNELDKLATTNEHKVAIVNQTVANSWKGFFPVKQQAIVQTWEKEETKDDYIETLKDEYNTLLEMMNYGCDVKERIENVKMMYRDLTGKEIQE